MADDRESKNKKEKKSDSEYPDESKEDKIKKASDDALASQHKKNLEADKVTNDAKTAGENDIMKESSMARDNADREQKNAKELEDAAKKESDKAKEITEKANAAKQKAE
jgi:hypothetical protein